MEEKLPVKNSIRFARLISVVGHPFVLLSLTVLIVAFDKAPFKQALTIGAATIALTVFPLVFIIRRKVTAGKWSDHDISDATERRNFYPVAIVITVVSMAIFYLLGFPRGLLLGMSVSLGLLMTAMVVNRFSKISLHTIFAVFFAVSLFAVNFATGAGFLLLAALVGWSRIVLERHTPAQVLSGVLLGAAGGVLLLKLSAMI